MIADIVDLAQRAGTLPMQGLMMLAIIVLGWVVVYLHKQNNKKIDTLHAENQRAQDEWRQRAEAEQAAMTKERVDRINMLIDVIKEDTQVKVELRMAIENNTKTTERVEKLLLQVLDKK